MVVAGYTTTITASNENLRPGERGAVLRSHDTLLGCRPDINLARLPAGEAGETADSSSEGSCEEVACRTRPPMSELEASASFGGGAILSASPSGASLLASLGGGTVLSASGASPSAASTWS